MSRKRHTTEEIVNKLRQADVELSKGSTVSAVCKVNDYVESFNGKLRDELLDREIFYSLSEAKVANAERDVA